MKVEFGWSKRADGSCTAWEEPKDFSQTDPKLLSQVLVAVHGPCPVKGKQEITDRATVQVILQPLNYPPGGESDLWAARLGEVLASYVVDVKQYPRSLIQIAIQPLNVGPSFISVAVNASFLALLHAAVIPISRPIVALSTDVYSNFYICASDGTILFEDYTRGARPDMGMVGNAISDLKQLYASSFE